MKVLYITSKPAYPKVDGGCVASANFLSNLLKVVSKVKYLSIETSKHLFSLDAFPQKLATAIQPEAVFVETAVRPMDAFRHLFNKKSYNITRFYNEAFEVKIAECIANESFDIVILDSLFSTPYLDSIKSIFSGKILVRTHNVEYKIWEGLAENEKNPIKKKYLKGLAKDLKKYEVETLNKVDGIMTLSQDDLDDFDSLKTATPKTLITVTTETQAGDHNYANKNLFHLGAMNWQPNIEAVNEVVRLMPLLRDKIPGIEFHIAGIESDTLFDESPSLGIFVDGYVEDLSKYISAQGILLSPISSGSGIRIKILEMMAAGVPVITTPLGAKGLLNTNGVSIATSTNGIIAEVFKLTHDENKRRELGIEAKRYVNLHHNSEKVSAQIIEFIKSI